MRITYYPETDSAYIRFSDATSVDSGEIAPATVADFDAEGNVVGIEIWSGASERLDLSRIRLERRPEDGMDAALTFETGFMRGPMEVESAG
jgi:uncharacterized protein YuzE